MDIEALAGDTYLKLRKRTYYLERRVPTHLVSAIGKTHIRESLKTADKREARRLLNLRAAEIERQFLAAERHSDENAASPRRRLDELSDGQIEMLVFEWSRHEANIVRDSLLSDNEGRIGPSAADEFPAQQALDELRADLRLMEEGAERQGASALNHLAILASRFAGIETSTRREGPLNRTITEVLADPRGPKLRKFRELVRKAWCERLRFEIALHEGARYRPEYSEVVIAPQSADGSGRSLQGVTLGQLIERYKGSPKHVKRRKTLRYKYDFLFRLLSEIVGDDKRVSTINRADCRAVVDLLRQLPANAKKKYPTLTLQQIVDRVATLPEEKKPPLLNGKTLSSHVYRMSTFFKYAETEEYIAKNPAKAFDLEDHKHSRDDKSPFNAAQLMKIFTAPLFTGQPDPKTGLVADHPAQQTRTRYWIAIIALFHGMRLNEICQLRHDDLKSADGIDYFHLQEAHEDQRLKTDNSGRLVPFHPVLLALGFPTYVDSIKHSGSVRLFPDLTLDSLGYYSRTVGRWFNERFFTDLGVKSKKHTFHSFRHNFKDAARVARISTPITEAICGRDEGGVGANYGDGYPLEMLNEELAKISYDSVALRLLPCFAQQ